MSKLDAIGSEIDAEPDDDKSEEAIYEGAAGHDKSDHLASLRYEQYQKVKVENANLRALNELRHKLAKFIFKLIVGWLIAVMLLVFLGSYQVFLFSGECDLTSTFWFSNAQHIPVGCELAESKTLLTLSETIVVALITTTTINVLGLSFIVANWLFPSSRKSKKVTKNDKIKKGKNEEKQ